jgi:hypothetical protein
MDGHVLTKMETRPSKRQFFLHQKSQVRPCSHRQGQEDKRRGRGSPTEVAR